MIVTVTPNPSVDRTIMVGTLNAGSVHRAQRVHVDPGGKGVNVARTLAAAGHPTVALMPSGGPEGARLTRLLAPESVPVAAVPVAAATRSNIAVVEADGTTTKFNEQGVALTSEELTALQGRVAEFARRAAWVVTCGSLPAGCGDALHGRIVETARAAGARVAVDASGPPLAAACQARPDLIKPNLTELSELAGRPLNQLGEVLEQAQSLRSSGIGTVLVTLGDAGALLVEDAGAWHATSTPVEVRSTVGAGDATLAGFLMAGGSGPKALRTAVAYGTAAVGLAGSGMPAPADLRTENVRVDEADEALSLIGAVA